MDEQPQYPRSPDEHPRQWIADLATILGAPQSWVEGKLVSSLDRMGMEIVPMQQDADGRFVKKGEVQS